jgi:hypothetical protein
MSSGGKVRSHHTPAVSADNLRPIVEAQIHGATYVMPDEGGAAKKVGSELRRAVPSITALANTFAVPFAPMKRAIYESYHHVSQRRLTRYLAEPEKVDRFFRKELIKDSL